MALQSRLSFLDLPRELRQHIIGYAFKDAAAKDHKFNDMIREPRLFYYLPRARDGEEYNSSPEDRALAKALGSIFGRRWFKFESSKIYAPNVSELATKLCSTHFEVVDDVLFIFEKTLKSFEIEEKTIVEATISECEAKADPQFHPELALSVNIRTFCLWTIGA